MLPFRRIFTYEVRLFHTPTDPALTLAAGRPRPVYPRSLLHFDFAPPIDARLSRT